MSTATKQQKLVPELRFSGFGGEWEIKHLSSIYKKITNGFVGTATPFYVSDSTLGVKYLQGKNVKNGQLNNKELVYISHEFNNKHKKSELKAGDLLMVQSGHVGECAVADEEHAGSNCHAVLILSPKSGVVDSRFIKSLFYANTGKKAITKITTGNTIQHILASDMVKMSVLLPHLIEQQKIADFLGSVDAWLDNLRSQKSALETYKRGMMQKLFTQQVRFKDDQGNDFPEWQEKKLGDVSVKSNTGVAAGSLEGNVGEYAVYGASGLYKHVDFYQEEESYIAIIKDGSGVGRTAIYPGKSSVIGTLNVLRATTGNNLYFVYLLLTRLNLLKYMIGGAIPHIYYKDYKREKVMVPILAEQQKIADFLTALAQTIAAKAEEITKVEQWKKGLMQKMFI